VPLYFLAKKLKGKKASRVLLGAKTKKELLFRRKFKALGLKIKVSTDDGSLGFKGFITDLLADILAKNKVSCVYSCGSEMMLAKIAQLCDKFKIKYQLSLEALIKCGFGVCGSCSRGGQRICKDGPVFDYWPA